MNKESVYDNCILLVDDNAELRSMLRKTMEKEGYRRVLTAGSCEETLSLLSEERPDLIILDINLPDGDGFTLMKRIRERNDAEDIPVLFLSARDKDADRLFGLGLGADDYIVKPFLKKELRLGEFYTDSLECLAVSTIRACGKTPVKQIQIPTSAGIQPVT